MAGFADDRFGPRLAQLTRCAELDAESRDICKHHSLSPKMRYAWLKESKHFSSELQWQILILNKVFVQLQRTSG
jgi:hypothetical protein